MCYESLARRIKLAEERKNKMPQSDLQCSICDKRLLEINGTLYCPNCDSDKIKEITKSGRRIKS